MHPNNFKDMFSLLRMHHLFYTTYYQINRQLFQIVKFYGFIALVQARGCKHVYRCKIIFKSILQRAMRTKQLRQKSIFPAIQKQSVDFIREMRRCILQKRTGKGGMFLTINKKICLKAKYLTKSELSQFLILKFTLKSYYKKKKKKDSKIKVADPEKFSNKFRVYIF